MNLKHSVATGPSLIRTPTSVPIPMPFRHNSTRSALSSYPRSSPCSLAILRGRQLPTNCRMLEDGASDVRLCCVAPRRERRRKFSENGPASRIVRRAWDEECTDVRPKRQPRLRSRGQRIALARGARAQTSRRIAPRCLRDRKNHWGIVARDCRQSFLERKKIDTSKLHVTFLQEAPAKSSLAALSELKAGSDRFFHTGKEIYLHCPDGYGRSKLSSNAFEKVLSLRATA